MIEFAAGILLSLLSAAHCLGMCGPLALAAKSKFAQNGILQILMYHTGRSLTYVLLGLVFGLAGAGMFIATSGRILSVVMGLILLGFYFYKPQWNRFPLYTYAMNRAGKMGLSPAGPFVFGVANGLLPCGLVFTALAISIVYGNTPDAVLFMSGFGLGTWPATMTVQLLGKKSLLRKWMTPTLQKITTVVIAVIFIVRGLNLGIPYISPHYEQKADVIEAKCCTGKK